MVQGGESKKKELMKYIRNTKHKITYMKTTIPYKVIYEPKSQLIKDIERLTRQRLYWKKARNIYFNHKVDISNNNTI